MFLPPMLCTTLRDPSCLGDPRYVAEPKFDGRIAAAPYRCLTMRDG